MSPTLTDDLLTRLDDAANDTHYIDHETAREAAARIRELEAQLATARRDALDEAAKVAEAVVDEWADGTGVMAAAVRTSARQIAAAIRDIAAGGASNG